MSCEFLSTPSRGQPVLVCELSPEDMAAENPVHAEETVEDRLLDYGRRYQEQQQVRLHAAERQQQLAEAAARARLAETHRLHTNLYYKQHTAEDVAAHRAARVSRETEREAALKAQAAREAPFKPALTPHSVALAERRKAREGLTDLPPSEVQRRRQAAAEKARVAALEAREREQAPLGAPVVSPRAQSVQFALPASERLYRHARERQHEESLAGIERQLREVTNIMTMSKPCISAKASTLSRDEPVHAHLYAEAAKQNARKEWLAKTHDTSSQWFRPTLDPTSELLARHMPDTSAERLYTAAGSDGRVRALRARPVNDPRVAQCTFKPQINPHWKDGRSSVRRSAPTHQSTAAASAVAARTQAWEARREAHIRAQAAERQAETARQCTFHPTITARASRCGSLATSFSRPSEIAHCDPAALSATASSAASFAGRAPFTTPWQSSFAGERVRDTSAAAVDYGVAVRQASHHRGRPCDASVNDSVRRATSPSDERDELMRIAYEALAEAEATSSRVPLDYY